ncbi:MAG: GNAT family N-acetyltransferase [Bacteroidia bacterium]|nr:GNAT family N-acetyltransferase [Bacteroidia bacterium]NNF31479.1 GNAT family N-acetyltransferase [Flavobacteriaceae bacterium]MBT8275554.1 GNAT family N-acetyltransferase [Bacteroidia bacterium]NNJ82046.1 GNAT family N-acetyltransferase [Flavobacteriaceae bacterium]NNK54058.1 GNAT family N-acetyltransferase [Flavobacteriaceae bacterium]
MEIVVKTFDSLSLKELHDLLQLRSEVFVVEQDCVYQDIDGKDEKALHVLGFSNGTLAAYTRCFAPGIYFKEAAIGRVVVSKHFRGKDYGHIIMKESLDAILKYYQTETVKVSAQTYLKGFYNAHGFESTGEEYLEDGIPHIAMIKTPA